MKNELKAKLKRSKTLKNARNLLYPPRENMEYYGSYADDINTAETHEIFVKDRKKILS